MDRNFNNLETFLPKGVNPITHQLIKTPNFEIVQETVNSSAPVTKIHYLEISTNKHTFTFMYISGKYTYRRKKRRILSVIRRTTTYRHAIFISDIKA